MKKYLSLSLSLKIKSLGYAPNDVASEFLNFFIWRKESSLLFGAPWKDELRGVDGLRIRPTIWLLESCSTLGRQPRSGKK